MRKKSGVSVFIFTLLFISLLVFAISLTIAAENSTNDTTSDETTNTESEQDQSIDQFEIPAKITSSSSQINESDIDSAYTCLEQKTKNKCSSLSVQEIALTIMSGPSSSTTSECLQALEAKKDSQDCWPSGNCKVRDTAFAILALDSSSKSTDDAEDWLNKQNQTPTNLDWHIQIDSDENTQCKISYPGGSTSATIQDKEITSLKLDSGTQCLTTSNQNFWMKISRNCYDKRFEVTCEDDFLSNLIYQQPNSDTFYISSKTQESSAFVPINLELNAQCFANNGVCDYEGSAWATLAFLESGTRKEKLKQFSNYLILTSELNKRYMPTPFIYQITDNPTYGTKLIQEQKTGNFWRADSTPYNDFYDTALALFTLKQSTSSEVDLAKKRMFSISQSLSGCFEDRGFAIRDTAIVLWAMNKGTFRRSPIGTQTSCLSLGFSCVPDSECSSADTLNNYDCSLSGIESVCCSEEPQLSCNDLKGEVCAQGEFCSKSERSTSDTNECCVGNCITDDPDTPPTPDEEDEEESSSFIWYLIIGILIVLAIIAFLLRKQISLFFFKFKSKVKTQKPSSTSGTEGQGLMGISPGAPKPGFYPVRRQQPATQKRMKRDKPMDDVFKKLKDMTK